MGRLDTSNPPPPSSGQTPPPPGYPNHHDNPLSPPPPPPPPQETTTRSFVPQSPEHMPQNMPPPESYPPEKPATYPPQQQQPAAAAYPPQQPAAYPPPQQAGPTAFPPQAEPVSFPPQAPNYNNYNTSYNAQPQAVNYQAQTGYQTPVNMGTPNGIAVGTQYLAQTNGWRNGLFDCMDDPENALITACFPCITFGQIAEIVDNGQTSCATSGLIYGLIAAFIGFPCIMSCGYRTKIRNRYGLMETPAPDWATHCFCEWCALCQEYRELKAYGLDPAIGWQGNMAKNQQQQMQQYQTTPPMNQTMM